MEFDRLSAVFLLRGANANFSMLSAKFAALIMVRIAI
jgi:hypothetical protein